MKVRVKIIQTHGVGSFFLSWNWGPRGLFFRFFFPRVASPLPRPAAYLHASAEYPVHLRTRRIICSMLAIFGNQLLAKLCPLDGSQHYQVYQMEDEARISTLSKRFSPAFWNFPGYFRMLTSFSF